MNILLSIFTSLHSAVEVKYNAESITNTTLGTVVFILVSIGIFLLVGVALAFLHRLRDKKRSKHD